MEKASSANRKCLRNAVWIRKGLEEAWQKWDEYAQAASSEVFWVLEGKENPKDEVTTTMEKKNVEWRLCRFLLNYIWLGKAACAYITVTCQTIVEQPKQSTKNSPDQKLPSGPA